MKGLSNQIAINMSVRSAVRVLAVPLGTIEVASLFKNQTIFQLEYLLNPEGWPCHKVEITPWFSTGEQFKCIHGLFTGADTLLLSKIAKVHHVQRIALPSTAESSKNESCGQDVLFVSLSWPKISQISHFWSQKCPTLMTLC